MLCNYTSDINNSTTSSKGLAVIDKNSRKIIIDTSHLDNIKYTRINTLFTLIALYKKKTLLYSICYSNSIAILIGFQFSALIAPESYNNLIKRYKNHYKFNILNFIFHYLPVYIFYKLVNIKNISFKTCSLSMLSQIIFWGKYVNYDVNAVYRIDPPLNDKQQVKLWSITFFSHYILYGISKLYKKEYNALKHYNLHKLVNYK